MAAGAKLSAVSLDEIFKGDPWTMKAVGGQKENKRAMITVVCCSVAREKKKPHALRTTYSKTTLHHGPHARPPRC